ncbi:4'-phosphopantetheinyl transferase family protein [Pantoea sp. C2G6]|uniref:4'-phosphopantetheinyl transferase family protein n=1 Tax=Pantoea sp. C2G6 TaxID=3243084 RepID=UPI003EDA568E
MAGHFVRWTGDPGFAAIDMRIPQTIVDTAQQFADKRRGRFLAARTLLAQLMLRVYGINELPRLITQANGRPAFADRELPDFSIAYAGNTVGVLLAQEGGRAGLDMEIVRARSRQTQEQLLQGLTSGEIAWVNAQQDFAEAVTQIWTLRQSILKLTGEGDQGLDSLRLLPGAGRLRSSFNPDIQVICDAEPMLVWSCALSPAARSLHLWEMDNTLQWRALREVEMGKSDVGPHALRLTSLPAERSAHPEV